MIIELTALDNLHIRFVQLVILIQYDVSLIRFRTYFGSKISNL